MSVQQNTCGFLEEFLVHHLCIHLDLEVYLDQIPHRCHCDPEQLQCPLQSTERFAELDTFMHY